MGTRVVSFLVAVFLASVAVAQAGQRPRPGGPPAPQSEQMKAGVAHFDKAFYDLTPRNRHAEAAAEFDRGIAAFELELAASPWSAEAHTYLARIYAVRKDFKKAGAHYDEVAALEPLNVDACVLAALAYLDASEVAVARARLVEAKARTKDPNVLARLDGYIARVDALKR
jgi:cytochrome c-type biogenesis protein CcmH/NrfG